MIRTALLAALMAATGLFIDPAVSLSQPMHGLHGQRPYGGYYQGPRGGRYGAKNPVKTAEDARRLLIRFFGERDVVIGRITERRWFFEADIRDARENVIDRVIVDKRSGRIRSIY